MSSHKLSEYFLYRKIIRLLLKSLGLWPVENPSLLYRALPYVQLSLNVGIALALLGFVKVNFTNIALVTRGASLMASYITCALKMICMIIYRKNTRDIHQILDPYFNMLLGDPELQGVVLSGVTAFRRLSWAVSIFVLLSGLFCLIAPIIFIVVQHQHHFETIKYVLPYPGVYPWDIAPNGALYKLHYVFESLATASLITITSSIDPLYTLYTFQMMGRLREMTYRMEHYSRNDREYQSVIRECVNQYSILIKCRNKLQMIYGPIVLWMIGTNAIILCAGLFQISQMKSISVGQMLLFISYVSTKMTQTFVCGWTGTQLTIESENFRQSVCNAHWLGNKRDMSSVIIMLTQKPLILTACNFSVVSVQIFLTVLNTTLSYFFLLQTLQHKT